MLKSHLIHVGTFGKPLGLKGEINIFMLTNDLYSFKKLKPFFSDDGTVAWHFQHLRMLKGNLIGKLKNYTTRTTVEKLKGKKIFANKEKLPRTKPGEFYIFDLINCKVQLKDNKIIGRINKIDNFGAGDLLSIKPIKGKDFYIPMNEDNVISVNLKKKIIVIKPIRGIL